MKIHVVNPVRGGASVVSRTKALRLVKNDWAEWVTAKRSIRMRPSYHSSANSHVLSVESLARQAELAVMLRLRDRGVIEWGLRQRDSNPRTTTMLANQALPEPRRRSA